MTKTHSFRHLDLFSGIGGFALAASWVWGEQHEIVSFCEIEKFPKKVLRKHWPAVPIHDDIKTMKGDNYGRIDLLTGGFPCQPYSVAGKQRGSEDDRALWPEMLRIIKEAKPKWVIGENVAGFVKMGLDNCLSDLESEGYETTAFIIPACGVKANHRRDRTWIIANSLGTGGWPSAGAQPQPQTQQTGVLKEDGQALSNNITEICESLVNPNLSGCKIGGPTLPQGWKTERSMPWNTSERFKWDGWEITEPSVCRKSDGIPNRVDRIKGLGNAIVPQVVVPIMECIKLINEQNLPVN